MPKINPYTLPRPSPVTETRSFTDPLQPGEEILLTMSSTPDYSEMLNVQSRAIALAKMYAAKDAIPVYSDGRPVVVNDNLCYVIAAIMTLEQPQEDGSGKYTSDEWVILNAVMPGAFTGIVKWAEELLAAANRDKHDVGEKASVPNGLAASTGDTSEPPPNTEPTPKSPSEPTPYSSPSSDVSGS